MVSLQTEQSFAQVGTSYEFRKIGLCLAAIAGMSADTALTEAFAQNLALILTTACSVFLDCVLDIANGCKHAEVLILMLPDSFPAAYRER